jgi:hypothetical protein
LVAFWVLLFHCFFDFKEKVYEKRSQGVVDNTGDCYWSYNLVLGNYSGFVWE